MLNKKTFNAIIIGAGRIGAFFDEPGSNTIITHAHGYYDHRGFKIAGFVDIDNKKAQKAASIWGGEAFGSIGSALNSGLIDVVSLATPDHLHYTQLKEIAQYPVRAVFAEKPLTKKIKESEDLSLLYQQKGIGLLINYRRRFVLEFQAIRQKISIGRYGKFIAGNFFYGKGFLHNGSHMIDLIRFLLEDEVVSRKIIDKKFDHFKDDPTLTGYLVLDSGAKIFFQGLDCNLFTIFELDLIFEKKRLRFANSGFSIEEQRVQKDQTFKGYKNMQTEKEIATSLGKCFYYAAENLYQHLKYGQELLCVPADAIKTAIICLHNQ
jgi:predicted dehydrogenase